MIYQWYPGHMNKARIMMQNDVKLVDLVIEILDARVPLGSRNPKINELAKGKARLILMNKADLADNKCNEEWKKYFAGDNVDTVFMNSKTKEGLSAVMPAVKRACQSKILKNKQKGILNQPIRAMVVGIPNVGKSTFINAFSGKNATKTGNKPGVTKGKQWIRLNKELELLDTPGILWPKFDDQEVGKKLAFIGSINDEILVVEELAGDLLVYLYEYYPSLLEKRYGIDSRVMENVGESDEGILRTPQSVMLDQIAKERGCLKKGATVDYNMASKLLLEDFRSGKLGKISLERPQ